MGRKRSPPPTVIYKSQRLCSLAFYAAVGIIASLTNILSAQTLSSVVNASKYFITTLNKHQMAVVEGLSLGQVARTGSGRRVVDCRRGSGPTVGCS